MKTLRGEQNHQTPDSSDPYGFAEAMSNFKHELAKDTSSKYSNVEQQTDITIESVRHYADDRSQENLNTLNHKHKPFLAEIYQNIIQENPILKNILLRDTNIKDNALYDLASVYDQGHLVPTIHINLSHAETYLKPENLKAGDNFGLEYVLKTIALKTGAKPAEIMHNERLVVSFIMLHEFGHALDFQQNYLEPEIDKLDGKYKGARALPKAIAKDQKDRLKDLITQPIPGQVSADRYLEKVVPFAQRLRALGINPKDSKDVIDSMQKSYREMKSETFADDFATDYIMQHYNDFFENFNTDGAPSEKVKTYIGKFLKINNDLNLLGLNASKSVKLTRIQFERNQSGRITHFSPDNSIKTKTGFLSQKITIGKGIKLIQEGDPASPKRYAESPAVENVYIHPRKNAQGKLKNEIITQLEGDRYFLTELTNQKLKEVDTSPEEMINRLKLHVGSKVMLMKTELSTKSAVHLGNILGGRLEKINHSTDKSPIQINHCIYLSSTAGEKTGVSNLVDPDFMSGGNTSPIKRIYRKWKSFFVETTTSTYEVIPYK